MSFCSTNWTQLDEEDLASFLENFLENHLIDQINRSKPDNADKIRLSPFSTSRHDSLIHRHITYAVC